MIYAFEARSIQSYILRSGKLKDMVGASELVNSLTADLLDSTLADLDLKEGEDLIFARRAGGALIIFFNQAKQAERFRDLWTLRVQKEAPGLLFKQALVSLKGGVKVAWHQREIELSVDQNRTPANLPLSGPLIKRYIRTGVVATNSKHNKSEENIFLDAATDKKRGMKKEDLANRFTPRDLEFKPRWPKILVPEKESDKEPSLLENQSDGDYLAIIHADGNRLGDLLNSLKGKLPDDWRLFAEGWYAFSMAVERATERAVQQTIGALVKNPLIVKGEAVMPIRPLILGGDDLTLLIRSKLALPFTETFLEKFETATEEELGKLPFKLDVKKLTACAGIVFLKPKMPFHQAHDLCESLCKAAKLASKAHLLGDGSVPASLIFHRLTGGLIDEWPDIVKCELQTADGKSLTMQPYVVAKETVDELPALNDLLEFERVLKNTSHGTPRELSRLAAGGEHMKRDLKRWEEIMEKENPGNLHEFRTHLKALTGAGHKDLSGCLPIFSADGRSPLADVLILREMGGNECN